MPVQFGRVFEHIPYFLDGNDTRKGNETGGGSRPEKLGKTPEILMGCKKPSNKPRAQHSFKDGAPAVDENA